MANFPPDRFDDVPADLQRVGAHRAPKKKGRGWIMFAWAVVATILLSGAGILGLAVIDSSISFEIPFLAPEKTETPTPEPVKPADPVVDAEVPLSILNGTKTAGLATTVGDSLEAQGWGGAAEGIGSRANASSDDIEKTTVYYDDPALEGVARGLVLALGVGDVQLSKDFPGSQITVVVGLDYTPSEDQGGEPSGTPGDA